MRMALNPETIEQLRAALNPRRERYGFVVVMQRWATLVDEAGLPSADAPVEEPEWLDTVVKQLVRDPPPAKRKSERRRANSGRPRVDTERYAAVMLGVIFCEYAEAHPKRWVTGVGEGSPFYTFASRAFRAVGLYPRVQAFREVGERWDRSRDFSKQSIAKLLFGGLVPREKPTVRRRREKASGILPPK